MIQPGSEAISITPLSSIKFNKSSCSIRRYENQQVDKLIHFISSCISEGFLNYMVDMHKCSSECVIAEMFSKLVDIKKSLSVKLKLFVRMECLNLNSTQIVRLAKEAGCRIVFYEIDRDTTISNEKKSLFKNSVHEWHGVGVLYYCSIKYPSACLNDAYSFIEEAHNVLHEAPVDFIELPLLHEESCSASRLHTNKWLYSFYNARTILLLYKRAVAIQINPSKVLKLIATADAVMAANCEQIEFYDRCVFLSQGFASKKHANRNIYSFRAAIFLMLLKLLKTFVMLDKRNRYYLDKALLPDYLWEDLIILPKDLGNNTREK